MIATGAPQLAQHAFDVGHGLAVSVSTVDRRVLELGPSKEFLDLGGPLGQGQGALGQASTELGFILFGFFGFLFLVGRTGDGSCDSG